MQTLLISVPNIYFSNDEPGAIQNSISMPDLESLTVREIHCGGREADGQIDAVPRFLELVALPMLRQACKLRSLDMSEVRLDTLLRGVSGALCHACSTALSHICLKVHASSACIVPLMHTVARFADIEHLNVRTSWLSEPHQCFDISSCLMVLQHLSHLQLSSPAHLGKDVSVLSSLSTLTCLNMFDEDFHESFPDPAFHRLPASSALCCLTQLQALSLNLTAATQGDLSFLPAAHALTQLCVRIKGALHPSKQYKGVLSVLEQLTALQNLRLAWRDHHFTRHFGDAAFDMMQNLHALRDLSLRFFSPEADNGMATLFYALMHCSNLEVLSLDIQFEPPRSRNEPAPHSLLGVFQGPFAYALSCMTKLHKLTLSSIPSSCSMLQVLSDALAGLHCMTMFESLVAIGAHEEFEALAELLHAVPSLRNVGKSTMECIPKRAAPVLAKCWSDDDPSRLAELVSVNGVCTL